MQSNFLRYCIELYSLRTAYHSIRAKFKGTTFFVTFGLNWLLVAVPCLSTELANAQGNNDITKPYANMRSLLP